MRYLANSFSFSMLPEPGFTHKSYHLLAKQLTVEEVMKLLDDCTCVIGHQSTVDFVNSLFHKSFQVNRAQVKLKHGDEVVLVQLLERLPEGKVLSKSEMLDMMEQGKIKFFYICYLGYYY